LECELVGRGGGIGGDGIEIDGDKHFRLGNGSEFPSKLI